MSCRFGLESVKLECLVDSVLLPTAATCGVQYPVMEREEEGGKERHTGPLPSKIQLAGPGESANHEEATCAGATQGLVVSAGQMAGGFSFLS